MDGNSIEELINQKTDHSIIYRSIPGTTPLDPPKLVLTKLYGVLDETTGKGEIEQPTTDENRKDNGQNEEDVNGDKPEINEQRRLENESKVEHQMSLVKSLLQQV